MKYKKYPQNQWYKQYSFKDYIFENPAKIIAGVLAPISIILWFYYSGYTWEIKELKSIITMPPYIRMILSAFVYLTLGAFLYFIRFYQILYHIFPKRIFNKIKAFIWAFLILFTYFIIIPFVLSIINGFISFIYNLFALLIYISPPLFFSILIGLLIYSYNKYKNK